VERRVKISERMRFMQILVVLVLIAVWGAFVPVAMAVDHCAAMGAMCEGPCAASVTVTPPAVPTGTDLVSSAPVDPTPSVAPLELSSVEPPPKSLFPSV
jgi:hypothetical protein